MTDREIVELFWEREESAVKSAAERTPRIFRFSVTACAKWIRVFFRRSISGKY